MAAGRADSYPDAIYNYPESKLGGVFTAFGQHLNVAKSCRGTEWFIRTSHEVAEYWACYLEEVPIPTKY